MNMEDINAYTDKFVELTISYGISVLTAILIFIVGSWLIKRILNIFTKTLNKRNVDDSLKPFLRSIVGALLKVLLVITVATTLGIEMTSFVAILGAAGLAVGLALQGSLSNFAGGVLILLLKPFKVGDFIEGAGHAGVVREIQIFHTYLTTAQNQEVILPNAKLSNDAIKNYSFHNTRRMDMTFGIGYNDSIDEAKKILEQLIQEDKRILKTPEHVIFIEALADSSVNFKVRAWISTDDFWDVQNNFSEKVKKAFDKAGIGIPFPQMDVHLINPS